MPILLAIAGLAFLALLFGPQLWVRRVMAPLIFLVDKAVSV